MKQKTKDNLSHELKLDFLIQTLYLQMTTEIKLHFSHPTKSSYSITSDNMHAHKILTSTQKQKTSVIPKVFIQWQ